MTAAAAVGVVTAAIIGFLSANEVLGTIALAGAATAGMGVVYGQAVRPIVRFFKRASAGVDLLLEMPERFGVIESTLENQGDRLRVIEQNSQPEVRAFVREAIEGA